MRESCLDCSRKHIAEAEVLMREALMGYPHHAWLAVGHMSQAEAELLCDFPDMAHTIRAERINYMDGLKYQLSDGMFDLTSEYNVNTTEIIGRLTLLSIQSA